jgi:hypothetical protein
VHLVEIFLPLETRSGAPVDHEAIDDIIAGLADRFGGATAFTRAPADGLWKERANIKHDRIIIVEVMVKDLDDNWWQQYRVSLEKVMDQDELLVRATPCRRI